LTDVEEIDIVLQGLGVENSGRVAKERLLDEVPRLCPHAWTMALLGIDSSTNWVLMCFIL